MAVHEPPPLAAREFWHGTSASAAARIGAEGFRVLDVDARVWGEGLFGRGIYVTRAWEQAVGFAEVAAAPRSEEGGGDGVVLRVELTPGTRVARIPEAGGDVGGLRREFGKDILAGDFDKAIPRNKHLKPRELFALIRWFHERDRLDDEPTLAAVRRWLRRLSFHGFGDPGNDYGIVIFDPSRLQLREVLSAAGPPAADGRAASG